MTADSTQNPAAQGILHIDRFANGRPTAEISITKASDPIQLKKEIESAVGYGVNMTMTSPVRPSDMEGEEIPGTIYLQPDTIDLAIVQQCIDNHAIDLDFGKTPAQVNAEEAITRLVAGQEVSHEEVVSILRELLRQA